jgi:hypothetical protein
VSPTHLGTGTSHARKRIACTACIESGTGSIDLSTESFLGVLRASHVGHASVIRHVACLLDKLVDTRVVAPVAGSSNVSTTVQNELNRKINVVALGLAGNLNTIGKTAQSTMGPATATVLLKKEHFRIGCIMYHHMHA